MCIGGRLLLKRPPSLQRPTKGIIIIFRRKNKNKKGNWAIGFVTCEHRLRERIVYKGEKEEVETKQILMLPRKHVTCGEKDFSQRCVCVCVGLCVADLFSKGEGEKDGIDMMEREG